MSAASRLLSRRSLTGSLIAAGGLAGLGLAERSRPRSARGRQAEGGSAPAGVQDPIRDAVADPARPESDLLRDATRHPRRVLDFFQLKPGMRVADIQAGDGYYTQMLSRIVGARGRVHCINNQFPQKFMGEALSARLKATELANVERLDVELDAMDIEPGVDAALLVRFYHDLEWQEVDRPKFNAEVFAMLKPGGVFGVVDHRALDGAGITEGKRLHRVEESLTRAEIEAVGFVLEAECHVLANPEDPRDFNIFDENAKDRDRTDRFVHLYRRPE